MSEIEVVGFKPNQLCTISFVCSNCHEHVSDDDTECEHCGEPLEHSELLRSIKRASYGARAIEG